MKKDKLGAFIDAVYAITITICIINLERPADVSWGAFWAIKDSIIVYSITFFMMVSMWVQIHYLWEQIERIDHAVVWTCMTFLFTSSFIPYMTGLLVSNNFSNKYFAVAYGLLTVLISLNLLFIQKAAEHCNKDVLTAKYNKSILIPNIRIMAVDILIKLVGTVLSVLIWPPTILVAVVVSFEYNSIATRIVIKWMRDETIFNKQKRIELRKQRYNEFKQRIREKRARRTALKREHLQQVKEYAQMKKQKKDSQRENFVQYVSNNSKKKK
ncbi:MAG: DUF1211 domain-containing protein [Clostridia bacterium]|nr:DUF1211 domain-containing protein [Clostridia bacterium]